MTSTENLPRKQKLPRNSNQQVEMAVTKKNILAITGSLALCISFLTVPMAWDIHDNPAAIAGYTPFLLFISSIVLRKHAEEAPLSPVLGLLFMFVTTFLAFAQVAFFAAFLVVTFWIWEHFYTRALRRTLAATTDTVESAAPSKE